MPFRKHLLSLVRERIPEYLGAGAAYLAEHAGKVGIPSRMAERGLDYVLDKLHGGVVEKNIQRAVTMGIGEIDAARARQRHARDRQTITDPYFGDPFVGMGRPEAPETGMRGLGAPYTYEKRPVTSRQAPKQPMARHSMLKQPAVDIPGLIDITDDVIMEKPKKMTRAQVLAKAREAKARKAKYHTLTKEKKDKPKPKPKKRKVTTAL
jgi:hypothetical protein